MIEVLVTIGFACIFVGWAYGAGYRRGIARANAIARDEHAADGFHVSEETQR